MRAYRDLFPRQAGYEHVSRYVSGLLLSGLCIEMEKFWSLRPKRRLTKGSKCLLLTNSDQIEKVFAIDIEV